jgi:hypothetical protein
MQHEDKHRRTSRRAMAVALLALFIAIGGTAVAANHYLITSTGQIKPSVLKKLNGKSGATGQAGAAGARGPAGANGTNGTNGTNGKDGADGATPGLFDFNDGPLTLAAVAEEQTVATVANVPAGNYLVSGKLVAEGGTAALLIRCRLAAEGDFDESMALLAKGGSEPGETQTLAFLVHHQFASTGTVTLKCNPSSATNVKVINAKISATQMQSVTVTSG